MRRFLVQFLVLTFLFSMVSLASATTYYFEANNVEGYGKITYGNTLSTINDPVEFYFKKNFGVVDYNLLSFTPGTYYLSVEIEGLEIDANQDGNYSALPQQVINALKPIYEPLLANTPITLNITPALNGSYGPLTWDVDLGANEITLTYDFDNAADPTPFSNAQVNALLANIDTMYTQQPPNGVMDANIKWEHLRVELNPVPVPSALVLLGTGIFGVLGIRSRKRNK